MENGGFEPGFRLVRPRKRAHTYTGAMDYRSHITSLPEVKSGKPCVKGTRITVSDVLECLADGSSIEQLVVDFPQLTAESIQACVASAAEN